MDVMHELACLTLSLKVADDLFDGASDNHNSGGEYDNDDDDDDDDNDGDVEVDVLC